MEETADGINAEVVSEEAKVKALVNPLYSLYKYGFYVNAEK